MQVTAQPEQIDTAISSLDMKYAPRVDAFKGFAEAETFGTVNATGKLLTSEEKSEVVETVVSEGLSVNEKAKVFGKVESLGFHFDIANSNGVKGTHSFTFNDFKVMGIIEDGDKKGYGREICVSRDPSTMNFSERSRTAVEIARDTVNAKKIEPGEYPTIIRPQATTELVRYTTDALSGDDFHQNNSAFSDRLGEKLLSDQLVLTEDPLNSEMVIATPFDFEGVKRNRATVIDHGVPKYVFYDLLTASEFLGEKKSNGSAVIPFSEYLWGSVSPLALIIDSGNSNEHEMIEDTQNGLLVQTFWYSNTVNPQKGMITGLTRDGLFKIEHGEISHAVRNMRYTDSYLSFFNEINTISKDRTQVLGDFNGSNLSPTMKLDKLRFIGSSK